jgi:hypothetical protein
VRRAALRHGAETLLTLGRPQEAIVWATELAAVSEDTALARYIEGTARLILGEHEAAAALLDGVEDLTVEEGIAFSTSPLNVRRGFARAALGDWEAAADAFAIAASDPSMVEPIWAPLAEAHHRLGRPFDAVAEMVPLPRLTEVAGQLLCASPEAADGFADALWQRVPNDPRLVALGIRLAPALSPERMLDWSARLRAAGYGDRCPLIVAGRDAGRSAGDRVLAAALAQVAFSDDRAIATLTTAAGVVAEDAFVATLVQLDQLDPSLLAPFIEGAMTDGARTAAIADALAELGADEQADAVRAFGRERFGPLATASASVQ